MKTESIQCGQPKTAFIGKTKGFNLFNSFFLDKNWHLLKRIVFEVFTLPHVSCFFLPQIMREEINKNVAVVC